MKITPGYGPASTPDVSDLPEARLRVLRALSATQPDDVESVATSAGVNVHDLAAVLGAHPNGVRRHLEALVGQELVSATVSRVKGRGRPSTAYRMMPNGRAALAGALAPVSADYLAMATAFAEHVAVTADSPLRAAHQIGRAWGLLLAERHGAGPTSAPQPAQEVQSRLLKLLESLGFSPVRRPDGAVALRTCPLLTAARANPEVLCQVHVGLVRGASETYGGSGSGGDLLPFAELGACTLHLPDMGDA